MSWDYFLWFAFVAMGCWLAGAVVAWRQKSPWVSLVLTGTGLVVFFAFILGLWISLERPPMRTMGETRLWYSFFLPLVGLITYVRWKYKWILRSVVFWLVSGGKNAVPRWVPSGTMYGIHL